MARITTGAVGLAFKGNKGASTQPVNGACQGSKGSSLQFNVMCGFVF
jgi:hypothetical protein